VISDADLDAFAQILIAIRDAAIHDLDGLKDKNSARAHKWAQIAETDPGGILEHVIPECVDQVLSQVCQFIDDGRLHVFWQRNAGDAIDMTVEGLGELEGWYASDWRERSAERSVPYS
jgi:hypothetical protein